MICNETSCLLPDELNLTITVPEGTVTVVSEEDIQESLAAEIAPRAEAMPRAEVRSGR